MTARNAQLFEPAFERSNSAAWRKQRMELLRPQQVERVARRRRETFAYAAIVVMVFLAAFIYMSFEARIGAAGHQVNSLRGQVQDMQNLCNRMEMEISTLSSLERVEQYAAVNLGMVYPEVMEVQYLDQQTSVQIAQGLAAIQSAALARTAEDTPAAAAVLAEGEAAAEPELVVEESSLLAAWANWLGDYFNESGAAYAAE